MFPPLATVIDPYTAARRRQTVRIVAAGVAVVLMIAVGWVLFTRRPLPDEHVRSYSSSVDRLTTVVFDADRNLLIAGSAEGRIVYWNWPDVSPHELDRWSAEPLTAIVLTRDGLLIAGSQSKQVFGWNFEDHQLRKLPDPEGVVSSLGVRPGTIELALGLGNGVLTIVAPAQTRKIQSGHRGSVKSLCYDPSGKILVTGGSDGRVIWRDASTKKISGASQVHQTDVAALAYSADSRRLVSGDWNGLIAVWDAERKKEIRRWQQPDAVSGIVIGPDGPITASWDGKLRLWSWESNSVAKEIDTGRPIYALAVGDDATTLFTVSATDEVDQWIIDN